MDLRANMEIISHVDGDGIGGNRYPRNMGFGKCGLLWLNGLCYQVVSDYQNDEEGYAVLSKVHGSSSV